MFLEGLGTNSISKIFNEEGLRTKKDCEWHGSVSGIDFDIVQAEITRHRGLGRSYSDTSIFSSKLICGDCGGFYGKRCGILPMPTAEKYGGAITNSTANPNANPQPLTPTQSSSYFSRLTIN